MKRNRSLWVILFGIPLLLVLPVAIIGSSVYSAGAIDVRVIEKHPGGCSIGIHVPAMVVPIAMHFVPECTIDDMRADMGHEARYAMSIARVAAEELANCPDGVFVDVRDGHDIVTIEKRQGMLVIFVDTPTERVECTVPIQMISKTLQSISI